MNIQSFLAHHGIQRNPFAEEDAQTDPVFKEHCIQSAYHPVWDKVYGDPAEPATAIVFGPKGSGKTAMRLQIERHVREHNANHPGRRIFLIRYDDFNPFLDHFRERLNFRIRRRPDRVLDAWRLWDHMDAILCLAVTQLVDRLLDPRLESEIEGRAPERQGGGRLQGVDLQRLDRTSARDLLLLACSYDQSTAGNFVGRWSTLRKRLGYRNWFVAWDAALAVLTLAVVIGAGCYLGWTERASLRQLLWGGGFLALLGSGPYLWRWCRCQWLAMGIRRHMRVGKREVGSMRKVLLGFPPRDLASQPLPRFDRTDDRYELLNKLQLLLARCGYTGTIVLVDRVDEPHLTGGKTELMRRFVWPLLDNKLLKHPGIGFKMMLPQELYRDIEREERDFHERARLDKQNVISSFSWSGEALYDLARSRMVACGADPASIDPRGLFDEKLSYQRLLAVFQSLRVPRHLFRFLYRVLVEHCQKYTDTTPRFVIDVETFEAVLAVYLREIDSSV